MNISYLMAYVARQLHTLVRRYSDHKLEYLESPNPDYTDAIGESAEVLDFIFSRPETDFPAMFCVNHAVIYGLVSAEDGRFLIGPVRLNETVYFRHHIQTRAFDPMGIYRIPVCSLIKFQTELLLFHNLFQDNPISVIDFIAMNCVSHAMDIHIQKLYSNIVFEYQEQEHSHNPYDQECREFNAIEQGDIARLKKSWTEDHLENIGIIADDRLRHLRNLVIVNITLAVRAAIRGGVLPEIAFSISDSFIRTVEKVSDTPTLYYLKCQCEYQCAQLVREIKSQKNSGHDTVHPKVTQCKDYIFTHLHDKILVQDIADLLGVNPNYLSEIFLKYEGVTIKAFILREKIKLAQNMLIYSAYTYSEIATYLGFPSQSYLGQKFKEQTGYTLRQYRQEFGVKSFNPATPASDQ